MQKHLCKGLSWIELIPLQMSHTSVIVERVSQRSNVMLLLCHTMQWGKIK
jgi:hypothetical protein